ncbi:MAG: exopolysaccharide biosynthesis polyprenyl glycosylphosphotransferase [Candidatus Yonathbacteria bacterium]|nr:exopolysaccharide biosynthesis polyprenyl glycosylphosphotransferase [Candidatus Yonathbacteria bacterium]
MKILNNRREPIILFLGDLFLFSLSLWVALTIRYASVPSFGLIKQHLVPFTALFALWVFVFFIAGLYEKHTLVFKSKLPALILNIQVINSLIAVLFFYLIPFFGITPKTVLFLHLVVSFAFLAVWRVVLVPRFGFRHRDNAILIGAGRAGADGSREISVKSEMQELKEEVDGNERYNFSFISSVNLDQLDGIAFQEEVVEKVYSENVSSIVIDLKHEKANSILPSLYNLIFSNIRFLDMYKVYEEVFDRIPLSLVGYNWFLENISFSPHTMYDTLKRIMDVFIAGILGVLSLVVYPFVILAIKIEDGSPVFIKQERIGEGNRTIHLWKFRSMRGSDKGVWLSPNDARVTKVGRFLRKTRIDELPQLWNVVKGDISLIGPRPDIVDLGKKLAHELPYYMVRNLIKPGLSGWAQLKQDSPPQSLEETRVRLAYDLYYLKNRSFLLDLIIALKTIKVLLMRMGR